MATTANVILETRRTLSDGCHPVKLRITHNRERKYYTLNITEKPKLGFTPDEWKKIEGDRPRKPYKAYKEEIQRIEADARKAIKGLSAFTFAAFDAEFFKKETSVDLFAAMLATAKEFRANGKIKTAETYLYAVKSLQTFRRSDKLPFNKVTPELLRKYENWMLTQGKEVKKKGKDKEVKVVRVPNSKTTLSIYLRAVRAAFNKAEIKDGYPFGKRKYEMLTGRNVKKALTLAEMAKIYRYDALPGSQRELCRDYFMLSYLCNGMNIKDLALLKYKDIDSEAIRFVRAKTAGKVSRAVVVPLTKEIGQLLDKYGQKPALFDSYVLPILKPGMNPEQQRRAIDNAVRAINKHIKVIAENIGIAVNVSSYTARHSFATVLKRSGASMEFISESLGHRDIRTTENYLSDFEIAEKQKMAAVLTQWDTEQ
jgi:integrase/recombinase XerD